jgi:DNA recombination protein RmuC
MTSKLENVSTVIKELEKDRVEKFGELASHLNTATQQTTALMQTTSQLREALASTKVRGQWGERMAEDVLRLAGFIENVNYLKEKTIEGAGSRPDFTFFLPGNLKLNMDVKFPLNNYIKFLETDVELEKVKFRSDFLRDVRARISSILDEGLKNRVIFCSPITLFAVLAVIRQSVDNFALERTSNEILSLFGVFKKQWDEFLKKLDVLGKRIEDTQKEYESLATTRRRQLERPLNKIDNLRKEKGILISADDNE